MTLDNFAALATVVSALFIAYQAMLYVRDFKLRNKRARIEKAIDLAKIYADDILDNISLINIVYSTLKINTLIERVRPENMKSFDLQEMRELFTKDDITKINKSMNGEEFLKAYLLANDMCSSKLASKDIFNMSEVAATNDTPMIGKKSLEIFITRAKIDFNITISNTLNKLEYFAMYLIYEIGDEETLYQSLQQSYRSIVKLLYITISSNNKDGKDKYYTNVIDLFNKWNDRYLDTCKLETDLTRNLSHRGQKAK